MTILLQHFPTEILEAILGNLCLHCQHHGATSVPDLDTPCGRHDRRALVALCRMSRSLCRVAQPLLFHYFSLSSHGSSSSGNATSRHPGPQLFQFSRTLSQRPDLARAVRAVELLPPPTWHDAYPVDRPTWNAWRRRQDSLDDESLIAQTQRHEQCLPLVDLVPSLLSLTTHLEHLRLVVPSADKFNGWCDVVPTLERMRVLEFVASSANDRHVRLVDLPNILGVMPNLQSLRTPPEMRLSCTHHFSNDRDAHAYTPNLCTHKPWEIVPATLTKAVLGHVDLFRLGTLLDHCDGLEDLEMFLVPGTYDWENAMPADGALVASRSSLRRLVVTMHDFLGWTRFPGMFEKKTGGAGVAYQANLAFRKMDVLEDLAVDQCLLHADVVHATGAEGQAAQEAHRLSMALPESIKRLHVGYVVSWAHLQPQLRDLADRRKAGYFPDLTSIRVDLYTNSSVSKTALAAERAVLADQGIELVVGTSQPIRSGQSQQMLTPSPGSRYES